jgi:hypothetical protein
MTDLVPGEMHFDRVRILVGPVGAPEHELIEVGQVAALDIAPNVTGGSVTIHGVDPSDLLIDGPKIEVYGGARGGGKADPDIAAAIQASFSGVLGAYQDWAGAIQGAALEAMRELKKTMEGIGWPMTEIAISSRASRWLTQPQVKRGTQAKTWLNTLSAKQRGNLRLISCPYRPLTTERRYLKRQRLREMRLKTSINSMHRSWQRSSKRIASQQASSSPSTPEAQT